MEKNGNGNAVHIHIPQHAIPKKYLEPIFFLAGKMAEKTDLEEFDGIAEVSHDQISDDERMVDRLAKLAGLENIKKQRWFRELDEKKACERLDIETAKMAALVIITLVMKVDTDKGEKAKTYFSKVRKLMESNPIAVPAELAEHQRIARKFLQG
ncbi:MAG: hypothetical protein OEZ59_04140 [Deltaproteobacteria bacterium]|nr:hypothetical protein [Deltaproteobacteria bacterium]